MAGLYISKQKRDEIVKELNTKRITKLRKTSIRNQLLHPQYVVDFPNQEIKTDNNCGNPHYKTYFKCLYSWEDNS